MRWQFFKKEERRSEEENKAVDQAWSEIRCPLCGHRFHAGEAEACSSCAYAVRCGLVMCPNCSYEFAA